MKLLIIPQDSSAFFETIRNAKRNNLISKIQRDQTKLFFGWQRQQEKHGKPLHKDTVILIHIQNVEHE